MSIHLREGEELVKELEFHFLTYGKALLWFLALLIWGTASLYEGSHSRGLVALVLSVLPLVYQFFRIRYSLYLLTNQRVYVEHGLLAKSKFDLPLSRITSVDLSESWIQGFLGGGDVSLLREGCTPYQILHIKDPEVFKSALQLSPEIQSSEHTIALIS